MPDKKQKIIATALELFAHNGFNATPTKAIADAAGVSEGLLFKHFGNKAGLLQAVLDIGFTKAEAMINVVRQQKSARERIRQTLVLAFSIPQVEFEFWRLQFKVKWEINYDTRPHYQDLIRLLEEAFDELGYGDPVLEAQILTHFLDGFVGASLLGHVADANALRDYMLKKYQVQ